MHGHSGAEWQTVMHVTREKDSLQLARKADPLVSEDEVEPRLAERHFDMKFPDPKYKPQCVVCRESIANPTRRQTRYRCAESINARGQHVALCMPDCFRKYQFFCSLLRCVSDFQSATGKL